MRSSTGDECLAALGRHGGDEVDDPGLGRAVVPRRQCLRRRRHAKQGAASTIGSRPAISRPTAARVRAGRGDPPGGPPSSAAVERMAFLLFNDGDVRFASHRRTVPSAAAGRKYVTVTTPPWLGSDAASTIATLPVTVTYSRFPARKVHSGQLRQSLLVGGAKLLACRLSLSLSARKAGSLASAHPSGRQRRRASGVPARRGSDSRCGGALSSPPYCGNGS